MQEKEKMFFSCDYCLGKGQNDGQSMVMALLCEGLTLFRTKNFSLVQFEDFADNKINVT